VDERREPMNALERAAEIECEDWWAQMDGEVVECLDCGRPMSPEEVADKLGVSADAATSLLAMLVVEGRIRISAVELPSAVHRAA
jgi:hypothetical protein